MKVLTHSKADSKPRFNSPSPPFQAQWAVRQKINYDACLALLKDLTGQPHQNPPVDWWLSSYWQTPTGLGSPAFWGLTSRYAYEGDATFNPISYISDEPVPLIPTDFSMTGVV